MDIPLYHVDAFTSEIFKGNPAAVCPLERWLPDELMLKIALENSVSETAYFIPAEDGFEIRWFTPEIEMDLCGHATLASAHVIARHLHYPREVIRLHSKSGDLSVKVGEKLITLDFPSRKPEPSQAPQILLDAIKEQPIEILKSRDYLLVFKSEEIIRNMQPEKRLMDQLNLAPGGVIVTAPGREVDFVSRFFSTQASIFEDPVTGSAHCTLIPFWRERLKKTSMIARQLSTRGGTLHCEDLGERVHISGEAVTYLIGKISI